MATVTEKNFASKEEMTAALSELLQSGLSQGIEHDGEAVLLVSGGSSPAPAYRFLSGVDLGWDKITVAMVDERWVEAVMRNRMKHLSSQPCYKTRRPMLAL